MSEAKPIYSGEALLRNWSESASGKRRIILEIEDNGGAHPFKGYEGERFGVVIVGPLAPAEHAEPVARKGKAGGVPTRKDGRAEADMSAEVIASAPRTNSKRRWQDMPASQQAGLLMNSREFQAYAAEQTGMLETATTADQFIKMRCDVQSKSDLDDEAFAIARAKFADLKSNYEAFKIARGHGVI